MHIIILAGLFIAVAIFFWLSNLPKVSSDEALEASTKANTPLVIMFIAFCLMILAADPISAKTGIPEAQYFVYASLAIIVLTLVFTMIVAKNSSHGWGAMQYPQLVLGMLAIFTYVGTEVTIQSNLGSLLKTPEFGSFKESEIAPFISLYWGSLMIGRFAGAIGAFNFSKNTKYVLYVIVPFLAFALVLFVNWLTGVDVAKFYIYSVCVTIMIVAFFIGKQKAGTYFSYFRHIRRYVYAGWFMYHRRRCYIFIYRRRIMLLYHVAINFLFSDNRFRQIHQPGFSIFDS